MAQSALERLKAQAKASSGGTALERLKARAKSEPTFGEQVQGFVSDVGRGVGHGLVHGVDVLRRIGEGAASAASGVPVDEEQRARETARANARIDAIFPIPASVEAQEPGVVRAVGQGLGSTLEAGATMAMSPSAGLAMIIGGGITEGYDDAKAAGADDATAWTAGLLNAPGAALDVIPGGAVARLRHLGRAGRALAKADKASGGKFSAFFKSRWSTPLIEGATEGGQDVWKNLVDKYTYDEDRDILQGAGMSTLVGSIVGGGVAGLDAAVSRVAGPNEKDQALLDALRAEPTAPEAQPEQVPAATEVASTEVAAPAAPLTAQPQPGAYPSQAALDPRVGETAAALTDQAQSPEIEPVTNQLDSGETTAPALPPETPSVAVPSAPEPQQEPFVFPKETPAQRVYSAFVHDLARFEQIESSAPTKAKGKPGEERETLKQAISLYPGRKFGEREIADARIIRPLKQRLKESGIPAIESTDETVSASDFLYGLTAPRANEVLAERFPGKYDAEESPGSGMKTGDANAIVKKALDSPQADTYRWIQGLNRQINTLRRQVRESGGLTVPETVDEQGNRVPSQAEVWEQTWGPDFVPLRTDEESENPHAYAAGFAVRGPESKQRKGRSTPADAPLVHQLTTLYQAIDRKERNRIGNMLAEVVSLNPGPNARLTDNANTIAPNEVALPYKAAGTPRWIVTNDQSTAEAFRRWTELASDSRLRKWVDAVLRYFHATIIRFNPAFPPANATMDMMFSSLAHAMRGDYRAGMRVLSASVPAMRGAWRAMRDENAQGYWEERYREARKDGALIGWAEQFDFEKQARAFDLADGFKAKAKAWADWIDELNRAVELGTRIATYDAMRRAGKSRSESAVRSRRSTADFARRGRWAWFFRRAYLFSGAGFQGLSEFGEAAVKNPKRAATVFGSLIGMGYLTAMLSDIYGDDDELRKLSEGQKQTMIGVMYGERRYGIPAPRVFGVFPYMGWKLYEMQHGKTTSGEALNELAAAVPASLSPLPQGANWLQRFSPTIARPAVEVSQNRDFANRPIMPDLFPGQEAKANIDRHYENVSGASKAISQAAYEGTGEIVDVSPEVLDHYAKAATGGVGTFVGRMVDSTGKAIMGDPSLQTDDWPIINRFVQNASPGAEARIWYENEAKLDRARERRNKGRTLNRIDRMYLSLEAMHDDSDSRIRWARKNGSPDEVVEEIRREFNKAVEAVRQEQR